MTDREWALKIAWDYHRTPYIWGGDDPSAFDCSGFIIEVLKSVGVLPREGDWTANTLAIGMGWKPVDSPKPGDLVFWKSTHGKIVHVEMCIDYGLSIGASGGGSKTLTIADAIKHNAFVKIRPINSRRGIWGYLDPYKE